MELPVYNHILGNIPNSIPYEQKVRRWDHAFFGAGVFFLIVTNLVMNMLWRDLPYLGPITKQLPLGVIYYYLAKSYIATYTPFFHDMLYFKTALLGDPALHKMFMSRVYIASAFGGIVFMFVGYLFLRPLEQVRHLSGPMLRRGKDAINEARRASNKTTKDYMCVHPDLWMEPGEWAKSMLISGGVGSGKTVILNGIFKQIFQQNHRAIIYDVKGDFTKSLSEQALIISPFDKRSAIWNISKDIAGNEATIKAVADGFFPEDDPKNKFFTEAARAVMVAIIKFLYQAKAEAYYDSFSEEKINKINQKNQNIKDEDIKRILKISGATKIFIKEDMNIKTPDWTWEDLAACFKLDIESIREIMENYHPSMANVLAEQGGSTTESVISTLKVGAAMIENIASGWKQEYDDNGQPKRQEFSFVEWSRDNYIKSDKFEKAYRNSKTRKQFEARLVNFRKKNNLPALNGSDLSLAVKNEMRKFFNPRQIIVQNGLPRSLGNAYIGAIFESLIPKLISGDFPDDSNRTLFFVCDEFPTMGKINFEQLITVGRSKGIKTILLYQDIAQLKEIYGENVPKTIQASVNTQIVCKLGPGETRSYVATNVLGKRTVAVQKVTVQADGGRSSSFEQMDLDLLKEGDLTSELGPQFAMSGGKQKLLCVRSLLLQGELALMLDFPLTPAFLKEQPPLLKCKWNMDVKQINVDSFNFNSVSNISSSLNQIGRLVNYHFRKVTKLEWKTVKNKTGYVQNDNQEEKQDGEASGGSSGQNTEGEAVEYDQYGNRIHKGNREMQATKPEQLTGQLDKQVDSAGYQRAKEMLSFITQEKVRRGEIKEGLQQEMDMVKAASALAAVDTQQVFTTSHVEENTVELFPGDEGYEEAMEEFGYQSEATRDEFSEYEYSEEKQEFADPNWVDQFKDLDTPQPRATVKKSIGGDEEADKQKSLAMVENMVSSTFGHEAGHLVKMAVEGGEMVGEIKAKLNKPEYVKLGDERVGVVEKKTITKTQVVNK